MKELYLILVIMLLCFIGKAVMENINENKRDEIENMKCIRILVNEDEIANGCDKYFQNDKWYKDFMADIMREYEEMK